MERIATSFLFCYNLSTRGDSMGTVMTVLLVVIIVGLLLFIFVLLYNQFQDIDIRIGEVKGNIDSVLKNKLELLERMSKVGKSKNAITEQIEHLKNTALPSFDLDRQLMELEKQFPNSGNEKKGSRSDTLKKGLIELDEVNERLTAYVHYYNDNAMKYNQLIRSFPTNIVSKTARFKEKSFYDSRELIEDIKAA